MVQISGTYKAVENKNFYELLIGLGAPEELAKERNEQKGTIGITVDGDKITFTNDSPPSTSTLVVGKEIDEHLGNAVFKSTTKLDGNVVTVTSTNDGNPSTRTYTFTDNGFEADLNYSKDGKTFTATQIYKRV